MSRLLSGLGHELIVAKARQVKLISTSSRKDDRLDAETLARLARVDPQLLRPIRHRSGKQPGHYRRRRVALHRLAAQPLGGAKAIHPLGGKPAPPAPNAEGVDGLRGEIGRAHV